VSAGWELLADYPPSLADSPPGGFGLRQQSWPFFLCPTCPLVVPLSHVRGYGAKRSYSFGVAPHSLFTLIHQHNTFSSLSLTLSSSPRSPPPLSVEPRPRPLHGKGIPLRAARTYSLRFPTIGTSFVQPRARTRYMQSSIDLSTRCISWGMLLAMDSC
jgi:hypothetical protein